MEAVDFEEAKKCFLEGVEIWVDDDFLPCEDEPLMHALSLHLGDSLEDLEGHDVYYI